MVFVFTACYNIRVLLFNILSMQKQKGFTLIELLTVVAIIGILSTVVLVVLGESRTKTQDAKVKSQLSQMNSQAFLFNGTLGTDYSTSVPYQVSDGITGAMENGTPITGTLFNDTLLSHNSLYLLANQLLPSTYIFYGWNGGPNATTGKWFFSASTSKGGFCVDWKSEKKDYEGGALNASSGWQTAWSTAFPGLAGTEYTCN